MKEKKPEPPKRLEEWELRKPHESKAALDEAITAFIKDAGELRQKYRLPDIVVIVQGTANTEEGVGDYFVTTTLGQHIETSVVLVAQALGVLREKLNDRIGVLRYRC